METLRDKPFLIGICGGSASGKTSVANVIFKYVGIQHCLLFSMDSYYKGPTDEERKNLSEYNFDHPDALDLDLLTKHLGMLQQGQSIDMPIYTFNGSRRLEETTRVNPNKLIIFEGILAFHDKRMRDMMDMKIFVDLDGDIRIARRIYRDIKDRGRGIDTIIERYHKFVKPAFEEFIKPTRKFADVIIPRGAENTQAIDLISQHLKFGLVKLFKEEQVEVIPAPIQVKELPFDDLFPKEITYKNVQISPLKDHNKMYKILYDFINGKRVGYYKMYLDVLLKKMIDMSKMNSYDVTIVHSELTKEKIDGLTGKNVLVFVPIMLDTQGIVNAEIKELIGNSSVMKVTILSVFFSHETYQQLMNINADKIDFITLYYGKGLKEFEKYILKGGFIGDDAEGEYTDDVQVFSKGNFERQFKLIHQQ